MGASCPGRRNMPGEERTLRDDDDEGKKRRKERSEERERERGDRPCRCDAQMNKMGIEE